MKSNRLSLFWVTVGVLVMLTIGVLAQSSAGFNLDWHVLGNGGGEAASLNYRVNGTIGQSIAAPPASSSASFNVSGGYWFGEANSITIYLPLVLKN